MRRLVMIPARGGSKRIPNKNMKTFIDRPILSYSIDAAIRSRVFDEIMVSTDSDEIAEKAMKYGAKVPFMRSDRNADDHATISDVILEVIEGYRRQGEAFDEICCLFPTAPFVTDQKLIRAVDLLEENLEIDTVLPVVQFSYPPQRGFFIENGRLTMASRELSRIRSQDLAPMYHDAGQFLLFHPDPVEKTGDILKTRMMPMIVSELEVQDIDSETDWKLAEMKYRLMMVEGK